MVSGFLKSGKCNPSKGANIIKIHIKVYQKRYKFLLTDYILNM